MSNDLEVANKELIALLSYFIEKYGKDGTYNIPKDEMTRMLEKKGIRFSQGLDVITNAENIQLIVRTTTMFGQN